ncbi:CHAT domain-containing protein [Xylariaceae sp. AK1471]|nr:CHAT domain-containing protein [Xylariaceae sp. AK1471]
MVGKMNKIDDIEYALKLAQEAVDAAVADHPERAKRLNNLANMLSMRYLYTGDTLDLSRSIQVAQDIISLVSDDDENYAVHLNNLSIRFGDQFLETNQLCDLEESIRFARDAVSATPKSHPDRLAYADGLGQQLGDRYQRTGLLSHLNDAIRASREVLDMTPENHPQMSLHLNYLGNQLGYRYSRIGAMADLEESIQIGRRIIEIHPDNHPDQAAYLINLGLKLMELSMRSSSLADIDESIQVTRKALEMTSEQHSRHPAYLDKLAVRLGYRYEKTRDAADLDEAIRVAQRAIAAIPKKHPERAGFLNNLAVQLDSKYTSTGELADIKKSIQLTRESIVLTPEGIPDRAKSLKNLGSRLQNLYIITKDPADLKEAIAQYESALSHTSALPIVRIEAARGCIQCCALNSDWQTAYEASEIALSLIPELSLRPLKHSDRQHMLSQATGFASDAASAALNAGKGPLVALNAIEQGRGVLAASIEEIRVDILDLRQTYPQLAKRWLRLREEWDAFSTELEGDRQSLWKTEAKRDVTSEELDELIVEIRENPEFVNFLRVPNEGSIYQVAVSGPIVVIHVSEFRCDAIIIERYQIRSLPLTSLSLDDTRKWAARGDLARPDTLEWLWDTIAEPVLSALGFVQILPVDKLPRVWWINTGLLSRFPIHAAGRHSKRSTETVLSRVISSYSSSVKAIIQSRNRPITSSHLSNAVLIAMEDTPGNFSLPFAAKEVDVLSNLCDSMGHAFVKPNRRKQDVLCHFHQCTIFHFAGHGYTDDMDPLKSYLLLEDWRSNPLTVADLLDINLREQSPFLAYLSACGTGRIKGEKFVDESIHLLSAFQLAGFRHVIGTLWNVNDEMCVDMARITYEAIRDGGLTDESVCRGLHKATIELRDRWLDILENNRVVDRLLRDVVLVDEHKVGEPLNWVPYIHFGA